MPDVKKTEVMMILVSAVTRRVILRKVVKGRHDPPTPRAHMRRHDRPHERLLLRAERVRGHVPLLPRPPLLSGPALTAAVRGQSKSTR